MITILHDDRLADALGGSYLQMFMSFGSFVIGLLSFILILYVNSFLMKRRKSDYGLYNVPVRQAVKQAFELVYFCICPEQKRRVF